MPDNPPREIALGVSGGIGAAKVPELVRLLVKADIGVHVILTKNAESFVTPMTLQVLSGRPVIREMYDLSTGADIEHIALGRNIALLAVAPATASLLARFAHGLALDFLATFYLAAACPVLVAPSMNTRMLLHPATRENLALLRSRGVRILEPDAGALACGEEGAGRLPEPSRIAEEILRQLDLRAFWARQTVLVTAGPTREYLDPARVVTNPSTGKMGFAVAEEAVLRGARTVLVSGPSALPDPWGAEMIRVETTEEMHRAVLEALPRATVVIKAAAPADFRPAHPSREKAPKGSLPATLELEPTVDILSEIGRRKEGRFLVGFSAGTGDLLEQARTKMRQKSLDLVVANAVGGADAGFGADTNRVLLVAPEGEEALPLLSKREVAVRLLDRIERELARTS
jgi:phosphopantothenoylcysteine decarboxylase / phosphopantothenate---cysteine ligase